MALSTMVVFQEYVKSAMIETMKIQMSAFNEAVGGALILGSGNNDGDYKIESFMRAMTDGMVIDRDPYSDAAIAKQSFAMDTRNSVKVGLSTKLIEWDDTELDWINRDPSSAGVVIGNNFAEQMFRSYFDRAVAVLYATMRNDDALLRYDATGDTIPTLTNDKFVKSLRKFGDAASSLKVWLTHSKPVYDLDLANLTNTTDLFEFANVIVRRDPYKRVMIVSDSPSFVDTTTTPGTDIYHMMCLRAGALVIEENDDFHSETDVVLGRTNIGRLFQAEWSANYQVSGYKWNTASGGPSPDLAALSTSSNWTKWQTTNPKLLPGVILEVN